MGTLESFSNPYINDFKLIVRDTSSFLARHGIFKLSEVNPSNLIKANRLSPQRLFEIVKRARLILEIHQDAETNGADLDDSVSLAKSALKILGLKADPEFFKTIKRSDIVEIYNNDHCQIFGSFNFMRICNYNLDDVLLHEWYVLYERSAAVTQGLLQQAQDHLSSSRSMTQFKIPIHVMKEKFAEPQGVFLTKFRYIGTAFSGPEQRSGFLTTLRGRRISMEPNRLAFLTVQ